jgi:hypothetical protein
VTASIRSDALFHTKERAIGTLQILDEHARALTGKCALLHDVSTVKAIIQALEAEQRREAENEPLPDRLPRAAADLAAGGAPALCILSER